MLCATGSGDSAEKPPIYATESFSDAADAAHSFRPSLLQT
jgi:hypothetical protein